MDKKRFNSVFLSMILVVCVLFCACSVEHCNIWYDYNFGNLPKFYYADDKQSQNNTLALKYNNEAYVSSNDCNILIVLETKNYEKIGYIQGSFIGSIVMGSYVLYVHTEDTNKDFIVQCANTNKDPMTVYVKEEIVERLFNTPIKSIEDTELTEIICINDLKDQKVQAPKSVQQLSCSLHLNENYDFVNGIILYSATYYKDEVLYLQVFDVQTYTYSYYTVKSQYYSFFGF